MPGRKLSSSKILYSLPVNRTGLPSALTMITVTKEMLLGHLYCGKDEPGLKIIDVFVCHLRQKLARATGGKHYIETVWGRGYRLCAPAEAEFPL